MLLVREARWRSTAAQVLLLAMVVTEAAAVGRRSHDYDDREDYVDPPDDPAVNTPDYDDEATKMEKSVEKQDDADAWSASGMNDDRSELEADVDDTQKELNSKSNIDKYGARYKSKELTKKTKSHSKVKSSVGIKDRGKKRPRKKIRVNDLDSEDDDESQEVVKLAKKIRKTDKIENKKHDFKKKSTDDLDDSYDRSSEYEGDVIRDAGRPKIKELDEQEIDDGIDVQDEENSMSKDVNREHKTRKRLSNKEDYDDSKTGSMPEYKRPLRNVALRKRKKKGRPATIPDYYVREANETEQRNEKIIDDAKLNKIVNKNFLNRLKDIQKSKRPKRPGKKRIRPKTKPSELATAKSLMKLNRSLAEGQGSKQFLDTSSAELATRQEDKIGVVPWELLSVVPPYEKILKKKPQSSRKKVSKTTNTRDIYPMVRRPESSKEAKFSEEVGSVEEMSRDKISSDESPEIMPLEEIRKAKLSDEISIDDAISYGRGKVPKENSIKNLFKDLLLRTSTEAEFLEDTVKESMEDTTLITVTEVATTLNEPPLLEDPRHEESLKSILLKEAVLRQGDTKEPVTLFTKSVTTQLWSKKEIKAQYKSHRRQARQIIRQRVLTGELPIPLGADDDTLICDRIDVALFDSTSAFNSQLFTTVLSLLFCLIIY